MPTVEAPDGKVIEFPDSMDQPAIMRAMRKLYPPKGEEWDFGKGGELPITRPAVKQADPRGLFKRLQKGVSGDVGDTLRSIENLPKTAEAVIGGLGSYAGRQKLVSPILEEWKEKLYGALEHPWDVPGQIGNYIIDHPVNSLMAVSPLFGRIGSTTEGLTARLSPAAENFAEWAKVERAAKTPERIVGENFIKAVNPSRVPRGDVDAYVDKATTVVKDAVANKEDMKLADEFGMEGKSHLPESRAELKQVVTQGLKRIFGQFHEMSTGAEGSGLKVGLQDITEDLKKISNNSWIVANRPEVAKKIEELAVRFEQKGALSPVEAEEWIAQFNESRDNFYRNPDFQLGSLATVEVGVTQRLRQKLDHLVTSLEGPGYQELKNKYGAYKEVEDDINRAYLQQMKGLKGGLAEYAGIWGNIDVLAGLLTANPHRLTTAITTKAASMLYRFSRDPDRRIARMFQEVDKVYSKPLVPEVVGEEVSPKHTTLLSVGNPPPETKLLMEPTPLERAWHHKTRLEKAEDKPAFMRNSEERLVIQEAAKIKDAGSMEQLKAARKAEEVNATEKVERGPQTFNPSKPPVNPVGEGFVAVQTNMGKVIYDSNKWTDHNDLMRNAQLAPGQIKAKGKIYNGKFYTNRGEYERAITQGK